MPSYAEVGDTERIDVAIDVSGSPVDPATLTLTIEAPDGTRTTETDADPDVVHDSAGRFHRLLTYTAAGMWAVRWVATSPAQSGGMRVFVRPDALAAIPRSLSLEELKRRVDHTMDADEDLLADDLVSAFMQAQRPAPYGTGRLLAPDPVSDTDDPVTRTILTMGRRQRATRRRCGMAWSFSLRLPTTGTGCRSGATGTARRSAQSRSRAALGLRASRRTWLARSISLRPAGTMSARRSTPIRLRCWRARRYRRTFGSCRRG